MKFLGVLRNFLHENAATRRMLVVALTATFLMCLLASISVDLWYAYEMPGRPEPTLRRVYQMRVNHGSMVYVSAEELHFAQSIFNASFYVLPTCFFALFAIKVGLKTLW